MNVQIYGDRLRSARILRGIKSGSLAEKMGWPPSRQTRIEQSPIVAVDPEIRARLARLLKFPENYFAEPPTGSLSPGELLFRAPVATSKGEKVYLAEFARIAGEFLEWIDTYHRLPPVRMPNLSTEASIGEAARVVREALGVGSSQPIGNLTHRVERAGIPVIMRQSRSELRLADEAEEFESKTEKHLGYSTRVGEHRDRPITILRVIDSWERIRWTIAHELGHHVLHGSELPENAEEQASTFASELLAPADFVRAQMPRNVTLMALTEIKLHWGISIGALIPHLYVNGLINLERRDTLRRQLYSRINPETGRTWGRDEPGYDSQTPERPSMLATWAERRIGGSTPNMLATLSRTLPADIVAMIISDNRKRPAIPDVPGRLRTSQSDVTDLSAWRAKEALPDSLPRAYERRGAGRYGGVRRSAPTGPPPGKES